MELRVGLGYDAHALEQAVPLVLGGVTMDYPRGLAGHSDGDVIAHALIDAILGAANLGDIGTLFPSGDEQYRGSVAVEIPEMDTLVEEKWTSLLTAGAG